jgi:hypothetical protein
MPANAVAVLDDDGNVVRLAADGSLRRLATGAIGLGAAMDGSLLVSTSLTPGSPDAQLAVIDPAGVTTSYPRVASATLGNGDGVGLREAAWPQVVSITGAADGSVLVATSDHRLRALVPADSPRARIAIAQGTYASFEAGRIAYWSGVPGALALELRTHGKTVARFSGSTVGGEGELAFAPQPPSRYDVRLRLRTATAVTEARAVVDTRTVLPVLDARKTLLRTVGGAGDDAGGAGSDLGRCGPSEPRTVSCTVNHFEYSSNIYDGGDDSRSEDVPIGIARAVLRIDGAVLTDFQPLATPPLAPSLRFALPARQRTPIRARVASTQPVRAKVYASVRASGVRKQLTVEALARELEAGEPWDARLAPSGRQAATIRTWLAQHRRVIARVQVRIVGATPWGPATVWESKGSRIVG